MTVLELKGQMLQLISEVDDQPTLERLMKYLFKVVNQEGTQPEEWWNELTPEQQADLDLAMEEIKNPANLISNELAEKQMERWKSQN